MTKFVNKDNVEFDAYKVIGLEERDNDSLNIIIDYPLVNNRVAITRERYKSERPSVGDFFCVMADGTTSFFNGTEFGQIIVVDNQISLPLENPSSEPSEGIPNTQTIDEATMGAKDGSQVTSGLSSGDGTPTSH